MFKIKNKNTNNIYTAYSVVQKNNNTEALIYNDKMKMWDWVDLDFYESVPDEPIYIKVKNDVEVSEQEINDFKEVLKSKTICIDD